MKAGEVSFDKECNFRIRKQVPKLCHRIGFQSLVAFCKVLRWIANKPYLQ